MSLLNSQWQPNNGANAAQALLAGIQSGEAVRQHSLQAGQVFARLQQEQEERRRLEAKMQQDMAMQLLQESRLQRAQEMDRKFKEQRQQRYLQETAPFKRTGSAAPLGTPSIAPTGDPTPAESILGKVTSYGYSSDPYGDTASLGTGKWADKGPTGAWENRLSPESLAISPDIERLFKQQGIKEGDSVALQLANGQIVNRRWDDRTMQDAQAVKKFGKPLTGRFDFFNPGGEHELDGTQVVGFRPAKALDKGFSGGAPATPVVQPSIPAVESPDAALELLAAQHERLGTPTKDAQASLARAAEKLATQRNAADGKPILRNFSDGTTREYDADSGDWVVLSEKKLASDNKPIVRNFADGTTREYDKATGEWKTLADRAQMGETLAKQIEQEGLVSVPNTNRYANKDGKEFFVNKTGNGKMTLKAYEPKSATASRWVFGSDGKPYALGSDGEPMQPIPDDVSVSTTPPKTEIRSDNLGTVYRIGADNSLTVLIPAKTKLTAKEKESYREDIEGLAAAKMAYDASEAALQENGEGFFGWNKSKVESKREAWKKAKAKLRTWQEQYPDLRLPSEEKVFQTDTDALAAGYEKGDVVMLIHPKTGKPARARLE